MSFSESEFNVLCDRLKDQYGSFDKPRFDFVMKVVNKSPYNMFVEKLKSIGEVIEDTDVNDDVSFGYSIKCGDRNYYLRISMIGPYSFLMHSGGSGVLSNEKECDEECGRKLIGLLRDSQIQILDKEDLTRTAPLIFDEEKSANLFQALFTDSDLFPWQSVE